MITWMDGGTAPGHGRGPRLKARLGGLPPTRTRLGIHTANHAIEDYDKRLQPLRQKAPEPLLPLAFLLRDIETAHRVSPFHSR